MFKKKSLEFRVDSTVFESQGFGLVVGPVFSSWKERFYLISVDVINSFLFFVAFKLKLKTKSLDLQFSVKHRCSRRYFNHNRTVALTTSTVWQVMCHFNHFPAV